MNSWQIQSGKPSCTIETCFSATWITWGYQVAARSHILNPFKKWPGEIDVHEGIVAWPLRMQRRIRIGFEYSGTHAHKQL
jgi:hypothetical protein